MKTPRQTDSDASHEDRAKAIRDTLRDAIVDRRLSPGAKLSEAEVGSLYSVSRTIARSALQMLAFEGLVTSERNKGAFVSNPSPEEARQIFTSRRLIETGILQSAAENMSAEDFAAFREQLKKEALLKEDHGAKARREEIKVSGDFHLMLAEVAGNAILKKFMEELIGRSSLVIALYGKTGTSSCGSDDHFGILEALEAGNLDQATKMMLHHINHIEADLDLRPQSSLSLKDALQL
ncbi:GntR family transcriptional regulator [Cohaesibacter marisflavi]|nr:GntR family transcriptional regulator [Cohaesibacter marisflavi]